MFLEPLPKFNAPINFASTLDASGMAPRLRAESNISDSNYDEVRSRGNAICAKQARQALTEMREEESKVQEVSRKISRRELFKASSHSLGSYNSSAANNRAQSPRQVLLAKRLSIVKSSSKASQHRKRSSRADSPTAMVSENRRVQE